MSVQKKMEDQVVMKMLDVSTFQEAMNVNALMDIMGTVSNALVSLLLDLLIITSKY